MTDAPNTNPPPPTRRPAARPTYHPTLDTWLLVLANVLLVLIMLGVGVTDAGHVW